MERLKDIDEAPGLKKRVARLRSELEFLLESNSSNMVYWMERRVYGGSMDRPSSTGASGALKGLGLSSAERRGDALKGHGFSRAENPGKMTGALAPEGRSPFGRSASRTTFIQATPIDVSELLREMVFDQIPTVILTSATLTVQGGFEHMRRRLGLQEARELVVPSHFQYAKQALLYLPPNMPDPRDPEFPEAAARCIQRVLEHSRGRAFCLFTSYSQMRLLYERLLPVLDFPILLHGTAPAQSAARRVFATHPTPCSSEPQASGRELTCRAKRSVASSSTACPSPCPAIRSFRRA